MNKYSSIASTFRRGSRWVVPLTLVFATGGAVALWPTATVMSAVKQALADPQSIFADRSPGERDPGALTQTKEAYPMLNDASGLPTPPADMLMEASPLPTDEEGPKAFAAIIPPDETAAPLSSSSLPGGPVIIGPSDAAPVVSPLPPMPILGGGGPGPILAPQDTPPDSPDVPVDNPVPPVSGVPEPASWATMIVGFLTIGSFLRRQPRGAPVSDPRPSIS